MRRILSLRFSPLGASSPSLTMQASSTTAVACTRAVGRSCVMHRAMSRSTSAASGAAAGSAGALPCSCRQICRPRDCRGCSCCQLVPQADSGRRAAAGQLVSPSTADEIAAAAEEEDEDDCANHVAAALVLRARGEGGPQDTAPAAASASGGTSGSGGGSAVATASARLLSSRQPSSARSSGLAQPGSSKPWHTFGSALLSPDARKRDPLPGGEAESTLWGRMHSSGPNECEYGPETTSTFAVHRDPVALAPDRPVPLWQLLDPLGSLLLPRGKFQPRRSCG